MVTFTRTKFCMAFRGSWIARAPCAEFVEIVDEGVRGRVVRVETVALATSQLVEIFISIASCMQHAKKLRRASMTRRMQHVHEACIRMRPAWSIATCLCRTCYILKHCSTTSRYAHTQVQPPPANRDMQLLQQLEMGTPGRLPQMHLLDRATYPI